MGLRPPIALLLAVLVGTAALALLLPLVAGLPPLFPPVVYGRFVPQHGYRASGVVLLAPVAAGILVLILCAGLFFWLTALPRTLHYRPRRKKRK
jgi:hypothetical protein